MIRVAVLLGYLGTHFFGSQYQPDKRTVEGELLAAGIRCRLFLNYESVGLRMAGRTDRGVLATGQIASFLCDKDAVSRVSHALTWQLPPDIWIIGWSLVPDSFHPRHAARFRTYRYYFHDNISVDEVSAMEHAASLFVGSHNFASFSKKDGIRNPIRTVTDLSLAFSCSSCTSSAHGSDLFYMDITAENYLWHMVRCIAYALRAVGKGLMSATEITERLKGVYSSHIPPAAPEGLVLTQVDCGIDWQQVVTDSRTCFFIDREYRFHRIMAEISAQAYDACSFSTEKA
jgi:tRNA pseudouridine38-40 synthase